MPRFPSTTLSSRFSVLFSCHASAGLVCLRAKMHRVAHMISRRTFLKGTLALSATGFGLAGYALAEPFRLRVTRYPITPPGWPRGHTLRLAVLADLHIIEPWMGLSRVRQIVARTNALNPDAVLLLGDYVPSAGMMRWASRVGATPIEHGLWAAELAKLHAPLGVHAVLGNHDWWEDDAVQHRKRGPTKAGKALASAGIRVHENTAVRVEQAGQPYWIAGLGDQWAYYLIPNRKRGNYHGVHDLDSTFAQIKDDSPVVLMAHEPDIFAEMGRHANRPALTVSGHTHGGQVRLMGYAPIIPSRYGRRFDYGHIEERGRHLVVSAGLGCSGIPVRFGAPPEVVLVELGASRDRAA